MATLAGQPLFDALAITSAIFLVIGLGSLAGIIVSRLRERARQRRNTAAWNAKYERTRAALNKLLKQWAEEDSRQRDIERGAA